MNTFFRSSQFALSYFLIFLSVFLAGCAPDLIVKEVNWNDTSKRGNAVIQNIGNQDAGEFLVYFNGNENPESRDYRPQVSLTVNSLPAGNSITLNADFAPLSHQENNFLGNFHSITVLADPKNMVHESNENNNTMSSLGVAKSNFVFNLLTGGFGIKSSDGSVTYGSHGLSGNTLTLLIINTGTGNMGQVHFEDYAALTLYPGPATPPSLNNAKIRLLNGRGSYNFANGNFSDLLFDVQIEDAGGNLTTAAHYFSGGTTAPLTVPVGSTPPTGANLHLLLTTPFSIDLGGGLVGDLHIDTSTLATAVDLP